MNPPWPDWRRLAIAGKIPVLNPVAALMMQPPLAVSDRWTSLSSRQNFSGWPAKRGGAIQDDGADPEPGELRSNACAVRRWPHNFRHCIQVPVLLPLHRRQTLNRSVCVRRASLRGIAPRRNVGCDSTGDAGIMALAGAKAPTAVALPISRPGWTATGAGAIDFGCRMIRAPQGKLIHEQSFSGWRVTNGALRPIPPKGPWAPTRR